MIQPIRDVREALNALEHDSEIAVDIETSGLSFITDKIAVVTLCGSTSGKVAVLHIRGNMPEDLRCFLSNPSKTFITHNGAGFDLLFLARAGVDVFAPTQFDTMISELATLKVDRRDVSVSLKATTARHLGKRLDKSIDHAGWMSFQLSDEQLDYCVGDIIYMSGIKKKQLAKAEASGTTRAVETEMRLMPAVVSMTLTGLPMDLRRLTAYLGQQNVLALEAGDYLRERFHTPEINLNSPLQVKKALASLGLEVESVAKEVLHELCLITEGETKELFEALLNSSAARQRIKMYNPDWIMKNLVEGFVHARFWQCGTATGRFSSSDPNLQQVPKDMRWVFAAPAGHQVVSIDFSQLEVRVAAAIAQDREMLEAFNSEDVHTMIGCKVFDCTPSELSKEKRKLAKAMVFTLLFGGGITRFYTYARLNGSTITREEAEVMGKAFFARFRGIEQMRFAAYKAVNKRSPITITLPTGLKRTLVAGTLTPTVLLNTTVQGTAAGGMKYAIIKAWDQGLVRGRLGAQVHDELVATVKSTEAQEYSVELGKCMIEGMREALPECPAAVEASIADAWGPLPQDFELEKVA